MIGLTNWVAGLKPRSTATERAPKQTAVSILHWPPQVTVLAGIEKRCGLLPRQCPLLGPWIVWNCVYVCACVWMEWNWSTHYVGISTYQFILYYTSATYTQAHAHMHPQTIWRQQTDGAKSGYCRCQQKVTSYWKKCGPLPIYVTFCCSCFMIVKFLGINFCLVPVLES